MNIKALFIFAILVSGLFAKRKIEPNFHFEDSTYSATYALVCDASHLTKQEMLDLLFRVEHVREYMGKFNLTITKMEESDTLSRVKLEYNYLIAKMRMEVIRNRKPDSSNVDFVMQNYHRTKKILPLVTYTKGDYRVAQDSLGWVVYYTNKVKMDREIGGVYQSIIKRETRQYLRDLREYIEEYKKEDE